MQTEQNQYDFINSGDHQSKKSLLPGTLSKKQRIMVVAGGVFVLLVIMTFAISFISNLGKADRDQMLGLARQHAEIIRVAAIGEEVASSPNARSLAVTTRLALQSSQADLANVVVKTGKFGNKELASGQKPATDTTLNTARQNNRFDEVFTEVMQQELTAYRAALVAAFDATTDQEDRKIFSDIYKQVEALVEPLKED